MAREGPRRAAGTLAADVDLAQRLRDSGYSTRLIEVCERAVPLAREAGDTHSEAELLLCLARAQLRVDRPLDSVSTMDRCVQLMRLESCPCCVARALEEQGFACLEAGRNEEAEGALAEFLDIQKGYGPNESLVSPLLALGKARLGRDDSTKALEAFEEALAIAREADEEVYEEYEALALMHIAEAYSAQKDYRGAVMFYEMALPLLRGGIVVGADAATALRKMGDEYFNECEWQLAANCFEEALEETCKACDLRRYADTIRDLGDMYLKLNRRAEAATCFDICHNGTVDTDDPKDDVQVVIRQLLAATAAGDARARARHTERLEASMRRLASHEDRLVLAQYSWSLCATFKNLAEVRGVGIAAKEAAMDILHGGTGWPRVRGLPNFLFGLALEYTTLNDWDNAIRRFEDVVDVCVGNNQQLSESKIAAIVALAATCKKRFSASKKAKAYFGRCVQMVRRLGGPPMVAAINLIEVGDDTHEMLNLRD